MVVDKYLVYSCLKPIEVAEGGALHWIVVIADRFVFKRYEMYASRHAATQRLHKTVKGIYAIDNHIRRQSQA